jgi:hypothetical protein
MSTLQYKNGAQDKYSSQHFPGIENLAEHNGSRSDGDYRL